MSKICCLRNSEANRDELRYWPHSSSPFWAGQIILLSSLKEPMRGNPTPAVHLGQTRMGVTVSQLSVCGRFAFVYRAVVDFDVLSVVAGWAFG